MSDEPAAEGAAITWREQAINRSIDSARVRAETRVQRFLDAALEVMDDTPLGADFTVQEVVERSGQSLRSFYQYFGGKQELLLALFEESVRSTAELLREQVEEESEPVERLRRFVVEYYRLCQPGWKGKGEKRMTSRALAEFAQHLLTSQPAEAARGFVPIVALFEEILGEATEAGAVRSDVDRRRLAGVMLEAIMFNTFSRTIGGHVEKRPADAAEEFWDILFNGVRAG